MGLTLAHTWDDETSFCRRCGCARLQYVEAGNGCVSAGNVVGISHILAKRRCRAVFAELDAHISAVLGPPGRLTIWLPPSHAMGDYTPANWPGWSPSDGPEVA